MILRKWEARLRTRDEAVYVPYVEQTGAAEYAETEGCLGFQILLRRHGDETTTITVISWWTDIEAVKRFAGDDYERAKYYDDDAKYLLDMNETVEHFDVVTDRRF